MVVKPTPAVSKAVKAWYRSAFDRHRLHGMDWTSDGILVDTSGNASKATILVELKKALRGVAVVTAKRGGKSTGKYSYKVRAKGGSPVRDVASWKAHFKKVRSKTTGRMVRAKKASWYTLRVQALLGRYSFAHGVLSFERVNGSRTIASDLTFHQARARAAKHLENRLARS